MTTPATETDLLRALQLDAPTHALRLLRNNVGAYQDTRGVWIRYGVGHPGGADLIGWQSRVITLDDVGRTFARFVAVEGKKLPRKPTTEQLQFLDAVQRAGGLTCVAYAVEDLARMVRGA